MERAATVIIQGMYSSCIFVTYRRRVVSYWADSHARQRILFCFLACFSYIAVPTHTHKAETRLQGNSPATVYHNSHTPCYIYIVGLYKYIYTPTVQQRYFTAQNTPPPSLSTTLKIMPPLLKGYELLDQTNRQTNIECCQPCIYCIIFYYVMNTTAYHLGITLLISIYLQPFEGVYITKNI